MSEGPQHSPHQGSKSRKHRSMRLGVWVLIVVVAISGYWYINLPVNGKVDNTKKLAAQKTAAAVTHIDGRYISFDYPSVFEVKKNSEGSTDKTGDNYFFARPMNAGYDHLAIGSQKMEFDLTANGAYTNRKQDTRYSESTRLLQGGTLYVLTKTEGGFERTGMIVTRGVFVSVSITTDSSDFAREIKRFEDIVASLYIKSAS